VIPDFPENPSSWFHSIQPPNLAENGREDIEKITDSFDLRRRVVWWLWCELRGPRVEGTPDHVG
jgi:hypothetical protein